LTLIFDLWYFNFALFEKESLLFEENFGRFGGVCW